MTHFFKPLIISTLLFTAACAPGKSPEDIAGQFWQRVSVSDAIYAQGPKAQQMLNRDISRCVFELRELERLGAIKNAIPTDFQGRVADPDQAALQDWDTPERDRHLFTEHSEYTDFEGCMKAKGWERVEHVPFDVARKGRTNYLKAHIDYDHFDHEELTHSSSRPATSQEQGDFGNLNE